MNIYTVKQVAQMLSVTEQVVRKYIRNGEILVSKLGDSQQAKVRITEDDLKQFLSNKRSIR